MAQVIKTDHGYYARATNSMKHSDEADLSVAVRYYRDINATCGLSFARVTFPESNCRLVDLDDEQAARRAENLEADIADRQGSEKYGY